MRFHRVVAGAVLAAMALPGICPAIDKPTGNPLIMSDIETEQPVPLAYLSPDGRTASCTLVKLHWSPAPSTSVGDAATLALDLKPDQPGASTFIAQFWNASLAGSLAWQKPWQGAHWKIVNTPATDGTGIDAALAVGMISTSARRPYPKDTLVIGNLHPDSSLGKVSRLADRLDAAAKAGITRVIVPKVEEFEIEADGTTVNIPHHAADLNLKCVLVDNLVEATEVTMNDPLPDPPTGNGPPKYGPDIAAFIDGYAQREQTEAASSLIYAPKEAQLAQYPPRQAAAWKLVYAEIRQGQEAYKSGKFYVSYRLLARANSRMLGLNALTGTQGAAFDVKLALETSGQLQAQLHYLMTPPPIDHSELQSAMVIAEMSDWAYEIQALLEGSELVTKQTFSQRTDATAAERDRAREAILSANEEAKYLLKGSSFFIELLPHLGAPSTMPANLNAMNLLPQLIPAQLATAQIFADGIRPQANDLRVMMLFDPRLAAYVNVLLKEKAQWAARERRQANDALTAAALTNAVPNVVNNETSATNAASTNATPEAVTPLVSTNTGNVGFDPGTSYAPPHNEVENNATTEPQKKLSDVAQCLIWVNTDCEIATLDQKYLRLTATTDPVTHEWKLKDRAELDALLQLGDAGALQGAAFAQQAEVDPAIFGMIYERATYLRLHGDDTGALNGLRNYWRCALLGNMCWQLAHTRKAAPVDLGTADDDKNKDKKDHGKEKETAAAETNAPSTNSATEAGTNTVEVPADSTNVTPTNPIPAVSPVASDEAKTPVEPASTGTDAPPVAPVASVDSNSPPVAPVALGDTNVPSVAPVITTPETATNLPPAGTSANLPPLAVSTNAPPDAIKPAYLRAQPVDISTNEAPPLASSTDTNQPPLIVPATKPAPDDVYTGGEAASPATKAQPADTNAPAVP